MGANSHKSTEAAVYCLPSDNNNSGTTTTTTTTTTTCNHRNNSIHWPTRRNLNFNFKRRKRAILIVNNLPTTSYLVVWTLIVIVLNIRQLKLLFNCHALQMAQVNSFENLTEISASIQAEPAPSGLPASQPEVNNDDDSDVISASEILTNPLRPTRQRGETNNLTDRMLTNQTIKSNARTPDEPGKQVAADVTEPTESTAAGPININVDGGDLNRDQSQESLGQQTSRFLLQLLILGLFILVSSALIIVYSIKFCVCQRRKERRLLRRALIGDISTSADMQQAAYHHNHHNHHNHLQQQQHLLLTLRHPQLNLELNPQHLLDDGHLLNSTTDCAYLQPTTTTAPTTTTTTTTTTPIRRQLEENQLQAIFPGCLARDEHEAQLPVDINPNPNLHYLVSSASYAQTNGQSQLILALLNRLQQLLALGGYPDQPASQIGTPQQLSQLIVAQLQAQFSSPVYMSLGNQLHDHNHNHHHQMACMCPHRTSELVAAAAAAADSSLISLPGAILTARPRSPTRPPAYSELYASPTAASGNDVNELSPVVQAPEVDPQDNAGQQANLSGQA